jgi:outer membrane protein TolC
MSNRKNNVCITVCLLAIAHATPARAQGGERVTSLQDAMRALFAESPTFHVYEAEARQAAAEHQRASGAFDIVANAAVQGQRSLWSAPYGGLTTTGYDDLSAQVGLATRTPENVTADITASMPLTSSIDASISPDQPIVTSHLSIPLLKFGTSASFGAEERATELHATASAALQQDRESQLVMTAASDYWRWVASRDQVKLARQLEELANDQLRDVDTLIEQRARAPVDRLPFLAASESAAASRAQAERTMFDQQQVLWATLGLRRPTTHDAPEAALPEVPATPAMAPVMATRAKRLAAGRPLFAYLEEETAAATVRFDAARIGERPDLGIVAQGSASRVGLYGDSSAMPTQMEVGYYGGVSLVYSMPLQNRTARGQLGVATEVRAERALEATSRLNVVEGTIDALSSDLATLAETYQQRARATEAYRAAYEAERTRYHMGSATAMDVIVAEQQLMASSVAVLADRASYAIALARMLHEAGVLNAAVHSRNAPAVAQRLTISAL